MNTKIVNPDYEGIRQALEKHGIKEIAKQDDRVEFTAVKGVLLEKIFIEELGARIRVIRFSKEKDDYINPAMFNYEALLGVGFEVWLQPICLLKPKQETLTGPPNLLNIKQF